jgi:hypothetical protein
MTAGLAYVRFRASPSLSSNAHAALATMTMHEVSRRKKVRRIVCNGEQFRRRGTDKLELVNDERSTGWNRIGPRNDGGECNSRFDEGATATFGV